MNGTSQPVPPPPGAAPQKKGLGPLGWILIGCGGIVVLGALVMGGLTAWGVWAVKNKAAEFEKNPTLAAAKLAVQLNPELDLVSTDEKTSTITIKNKKTGEVATFSAEDAKDGRFVFKTDKGTATFDASGSSSGGSLQVTNEKGEVATFNAGTGTPQNLPSWLPTYPGGTVQGTYDSTNNDGRAAAFSVSTQDGAGRVLDFYETQLKSSGLKVEKTSIASNDQTSGGTVTGKSGDEKRQVSVIVSSSDQGTQAIITFQEKK